MSAMISVRGRAAGSDRMISATGGRGLAVAGAMATTAADDVAIAKIGAGCGPGCRKSPLIMMAAIAVVPATASTHSRGRLMNTRRTAGSRSGRRRSALGVRRTLISGAPTVSRRLRSERSPASNRRCARVDQRCSAEPQRWPARSAS